MLFLLPESMFIMDFELNTDSLGELCSWEGAMYHLTVLIL